jgi:hypothetical protein
MQFGNKKRKRTSKIGKKKAKKINGKDVNHHMAVKKQIATGSGQGLVYTLIKRMQPNVVKVNKRRQGSNDETSNICRARKAWCMQLAIRMGLVDYRDVMREGGIPDDVPVPKWFDKEKLTPLKLEQIVFFDEMH